MANVLVSEDEYLQMRSKKEDKRNLKEFVQCRVYETVKTIKNELERTRKENEQL